MKTYLSCPYGLRGTAFSPNPARTLIPVLVSDSPGSGSDVIQPTPPPAPTGLVEPLRPQELEVLRLIAAGRSNAEIAATLVIAVSTVKWHINNIYGKLDVRSRTQAIARAHELGVL